MRKLELLDSLGIMKHFLLDIFNNIQIKITTVNPPQFSSPNFLSRIYGFFRTYIFLLYSANLFLNIFGIWKMNIPEISLT